MALDFGLLDSVFRSEGTGVTQRIDTSDLAFREEERENAPPEISQGEAIIWTPGQGSYDIYNNIINTGLWTTGGFGGAVASETALIITVQAPTEGHLADWGGTLQTNNMPTLINMTELSFRCILTAVNTDPGFGSVYAHLNIFGNLIKTSTSGIGGGTVTNDSIWTAIKKEDGDWDIYDDGVLDSTITPTDNTIKVEIDTDFFGGANTQGGTASLYVITIDGRSYLMVGGKTGTFRVLLEQV